MSTYKDRLQAVGLQILEARRSQFDLIHTYKFSLAELMSTLQPFYTVQWYQSTRDYGYKLYLLECQTDVRKFFFSERVIRS